MSSDMPDWLRDLSRGVENAEDNMPAEPEPEPEIDPLADLRSQMNEEPESAASMPAADSRHRGESKREVVNSLIERLGSDKPESRRAGSRSQSSRSRRGAMGLLPWQSFVLSVLLFFDIAFVGMLFLVMLGRVVFPIY